MQILGKVIESGIDWITATGKSKSSQLKMQSFGEKLLRTEKRRGNILRPWGFSGYEGFKCGSIQVGTRSDSTIIRLGSKLASDNWHETYRVSENFSRVDVQTSIKVDRNPQQIISLVYRQASRKAAKSKRPPQVTLLRSNNGSATVYLGHRSSARFGRVYDKGKESGLGQYSNVIRFEEELKGNLCLSLLRAISHRDRPTIDADSEVRWFFRKRGVHLLAPATDFFAISEPANACDFERRLAWIRDQVRPSIKLLLDAGLYAEVLTACGLDSNTFASRKARQFLKTG
jgi:hypothetical protein